MAASAATASSSPGLCPNYAVICSFLERYGTLLDLPELTFPQLERYLQDTSSVPKLLVDLHVKLLRKIGKSVSAGRWEKYLIKVCQEFNTTWAWELEQKGYKEMPTKCKTAILKYLCECQFDENIKFKTAINEEDPDKMRLQPIGRDKDGQMYWFQLDQDNNVRVYVEEQDDLDGSSWKCIVKDRNDLAEVVALLKTQIDPELLKKGQETKPDGEEEKDKAEDKGEDKKTEDTSDEDSNDSKKTVCPVSPKTENNNEKVTQNDSSISEASEAKSSLNGVIEGKTEAELRSEKSTADLSINTKAKSIKEEPMEVSETKTSTATGEALCLSVKAEKGEEAKKNSGEEIQQALKNDQQAKIPLKKRGMKFSEDFEKNSGIIVQNPSVAQVKEAPKAGSTAEPTKTAQSVNDHVNGEVQPTSEGHLCESLKDAAVDKKQTTEQAAGRSVETRENELPSTDKDHVKDKKDDAEKVTEGVKSLQADVDKKNLDTQVEKEKGSNASKEKYPLTSTEPPLLNKDVNNTPEKSSKHEEHEKIKESKPAESCTGDKTTTLKESDKTFMTGESEKVTSKEVESKDSEGKPACSESSQTEGTKTSKKTENVTDMMQVETSDAKEIKTCETNVEESDNSAQKEKPEIMKTTETQCADKDPAKKSVDSEKAVSPSVIKKAEFLKDGDKTEAQDVTKTSEIIKKADKPEISEKSQEEPNTKDSVESSVVEKLDKSDSRKPVEKQDNIKDGEVTQEKNSETSKTNAEKTERPDKTVKPEDKKRTVNCDDNTKQDAGKISKSIPEPMEVEAAAVKHDLTKPQEDDKTEMNSVSHKTTEEASKGKDKSSSPVEKTSVSKETNKKPERPEKDQEKESKEQPKKEKAEHLSSEGKRDADKENEKGADTKKKEEKLQNDSEKDKEIKEDSTLHELTKTDETKEEKQAHKESEASNKTEESAHQNVSKKTDGRPKKMRRPSKKTETEKPTDEENKSKSDEEESATKKEVANGEDAPADARKSKRYVHRRKAELQREERQDSESDTNTGRSLRRSPRISRPTPKAVEIQDRKLEKSQVTPSAEKSEDDKGEKEKGEEEEEDEEEEVKTVQKKPREKKADQEGQPKPKGRKRRKVRWSNTRTRRKKKGSEDEDSDDESSEEEESEEEDTSDEDYKVERSRKRRNRNRERRSSDSSTSSDDDLPPNDDPCKHCGLPNHPELILLCDSCDSGYHTACLRPPLMIIPDGEWFCPPCQHKQLCDKLEEQLQNLDAALKKKERAERRKERLIYVGISVENIITPSVEVEDEKPEIIIKEKKDGKKNKGWGRRSTRARKSISYRFDEFDEAIEEAIEEDIKEAEGGGAGRGKDMANITGHRGKDMSTILQAEEGKENGRPPRPTAGQRKKKRRRLNDLDSDSTVDEEESEEEFCLSESSEEEFVVSETEVESEADSNNSDFGSNSSGRHRTTSRTRRLQAQRRSSRKRRRPKGYSDDEEEETDEEEEDEIVTESSSEFSSSDLDMSRRRSRRSQKKQVNYCETSESEGSQAETNRAKMKPRRRQDSSDSEASFSKESEEELRDRRSKRRGDSSEEDSRQKRRRLALKRRRASEDDDSDESSSEDRPIRKRVNRIDSDDEDEEEEEGPEEKKADEESKGTNAVDSNPVGLPPTNGQNPIKSLEGFVGRPAATAAPGLVPNLEPPKNMSATPAAAIAPNGLVGQEMAAQDDDEDDLLGVTDLVDYVCNNEDL